MNKFEFDIINEKCWQYLNGEKVLIDPEQKKRGIYRNQTFFQLDQENMAH